MNSENKKPEHIEKNMSNAGMHKHISNKRPNPAFYNKDGNHSQSIKKRHRYSIRFYIKNDPDTVPEKHHKYKNENINSNNPKYNAVIAVSERSPDYIHT